eukprot:355664-Chlamydomonas_euryale.AAC.2
MIAAAGAEILWLGMAVVAGAGAGDTRGRRRGRGRSWDACTAAGGRPSTAAHMAAGARQLEELRTQPDSCMTYHQGCRKPGSWTVA